MNIFWRYSVFALLAVLLGSWYQNAVSFDGGYRSAQRYPPDFPQINRPVSAHFSADSARADSLLGAMWNAYNFGQWDSLLELSRVSCLLTEDLVQQKFDSAVYEYWLLGYLAHGQSMVYLGDIGQGSEIMNEALALRKRIFGDNFSLAFEYYGLGHMAIHLFDDPDLALDYYRLGEATARKSLPPDHPELANCFRNLGLGYWLKGDYATAMRYYQQVIHLKNLLPIQRARIYKHIGDRHADIGDEENALRYYFLCRTLDGVEARTDFTRELAIGEIYLKQGKNAECAGQIRRCEKLFRASEPEFAPQGLLTDLLRLKADYAFEKKEYRNAIQLARSAIAAAEKSRGGQYSPTTLALWQQLAGFHLAADQYLEAEAALRELFRREIRQPASPDFTRNPSSAQFTRQPYHLRTLELKGLYFERQFAHTGQSGFLRNALSAYLLADTLVNRIRDTYRGVGSKNQLSGSARPIYQHALNCCYVLWQQSGDAAYLDLAWRLMEKSKALDLLESLRETEARQMTNIRTLDFDQEKRLKRNLNYYEQLVFDERLKVRPDSNRISEWHRQIAALKASQDSLLLVFRTRYPEYYRMKYNRQLASVREVRDKLGDGSALVAYFMGDTVLFTFLIDGAQCRLYRQKMDTSFQQDLSALRAIVHDFDPAVLRTTEQKSADFHVFTQTSYRLYQYLLAAPLAQTQAERLVIVPDDVIGYVPFAALLRSPVPPNTPPDYRILPYLVRKYVVRQEYSGTVFANPKTAAATGSYLGMAPEYSGAAIASRGLPDSLRFTRVFGNRRGAELPALQYNDEEVVLAQRAMGGSSRVGPDATEAFFKQNGPQAAVLHLAMHALTNDVDPMYSTLVFSGGQADSTGENDGLLHAYELYDLRLNARLAVLSACNTGAGKVVRGEGVMSLARAFKYAGCPNVMMSLWPVNDLAAKNLVDDFFQQLHGGLGKARALRAAQNDFLDHTTSDELTHPFYWAGFMLIGDDEAVETRSGEGWWWVVGVGGLVLLWGVWRRNCSV